MYGSLQNLMAKDTYPKVPEIGMGATIILWTDRNPATIIAVHPNGRKCTIQEDKATRTDTNGLSDAQSWSFDPDPNGRIYEVSLRKDGRWKIINGQTVVLIGSRDKYYDPSF